MDTDQHPPAEPSTGPRTMRQHRFRAPAGSTELFLVRHGESQAAVEGEPFDLVGGHGDPPLAPDGRTQAERVGERLADEGISAIYVTTLQRTAQTAAPLAARLGLTPRVEADLREVFLGEWEGGLLRFKTAAGDPIARRLFTEQRWDVIPGAEAQEAFSGRVRSGLDRIVAAHRDERVAVVVHGGVIGEALAQVVGAERRMAFAGADNGSISHLVAVGERWILRRFNDTAHLAPGYDLDGPAEDTRPTGGPGWSA